MTELGQLKKYYRNFQDRGIRIIAVSVDSPALNARLRRRLGADYMFLSDPDLSLIDNLGIRHRRTNDNVDALAVPAQFLVDGQGVIGWLYRTATWRQRLPHKRVLEAMEVVRA